MKDQLLLLQELQQLDAKVREVRQAIEALPEKLAPAKRDLARFEARLQQEKDQIADTENWRAEQEEFIRREDEALKKARTKLQATKSAKDFAAASREIDNKKRSISEREEEVLKVIEALETTRKTMEDHEKDVETLRQHIAAEEDKIRTALTELEADLADKQANRDKVAQGVPGQLLKRYDTVQRRKGLAVVPVTNGICGGCHMSLPPQLNNILARFESIEACPACQRLLYRIELLQDETDAQQA